MARNRNPRLHWRRALLATTAALSLGQNAAWATCLDGTTFPAGGYQIGSKRRWRSRPTGRRTSSPATEGSYLHPGHLDQRSDHRRTDGRRAQLGLRPGLDALQAG